MKTYATSEKIIKENLKNLEDIQEVGKSYYKDLTFHHKKYHKIKCKLKDNLKMTLKIHKSIASNIFTRNNCNKMKIMEISF